MLMFQLTTAPKIESDFVAYLDDLEKLSGQSTLTR